MVNKAYLVMKKIFQYIIFYPAGANSSLEIKGKVAVLNSLVFITVFILTPFIIQIYFLGDHSRLFQTGLLAIGMLVLFISFKISKKIKRHISIFIFLLTAACLYFAYMDGYSYFSILLIYSYPLVTFFFMGPGKGLVLNSVMFGLLSLLLLNIKLPFREAWYPLLFSTRFLVSYLIIIISSFAIENIYIYTLKKLEKFAMTDKLTNLPNRTYIYQYLNQLIKISGRSNSQFSVFFLDLDKFKEINDTQGHKAGDSILITIAERLKSSIRSNDVVARLGGDEFVIIMSDIKDEISPVVLANKLRKTAKKSITIGETKNYLSLSIGIANYPADAANTDDLLKKADFAMYQAKNAGKDCYRFFCQEQDKKMYRKLQIEKHLRKGLSNNEFRIAMQPKVNTFTGELLGVEALLRWNSSYLGIIGPDVFIPIAEESGIIHSLGMWVFQESLRIYKDLKLAGSKDLLLSINLSPVQLQDRKFPSKIYEIVKKSEIEIENIEFEITEGLLIQNDSGIHNALNELTCMGFQLAIDDFGTGYSSLSYLKRFKVDTLKIDKSFIQNMLKDKDYLEIVKVIISMANIFMGCDQIQGYYFSKPLEYSDILNYVKKESLKTRSEEEKIKVLAY